jgi:hypothetical protein
VMVFRKDETTTNRCGVTRKEFIKDFCNLKLFLF